MTNTHACLPEIQTERKAFPQGPKVEVQRQGHFDSQINTPSESYDGKASRGTKENVSTYTMTSLYSRQGSYLMKKGGQREDIQK